MKKKNIHITILLILVVVVVVGGCVSIKDVTRITSDAIDHGEQWNVPRSELKINNADNNTKRIIYSILNKSDKNATEYISSIDVLPAVDDICSENSTGCTISNFTAGGRLLDAKIYIIDPSSYKGLCDTFEHTLYHEKGHVVYFYKFGNDDIEGRDNLYRESLESYAEKYADMYAKIQKEGCDKAEVDQMKYRLSEKAKIYEYSDKVLSKWNKYKDSGIPMDMYEQYQYDYDLYVIAKREYSDIIEQSKDYIKRAQD